MLLFRFLFSLSALLPKGKNLPELMLLLLGVMLPASRFTRPGETTPSGEGAPVDFGAVMGEVITSSPLVERDGIMLGAVCEVLWRCTLQCLYSVLMLGCGSMLPHPARQQ